MTEQAVALTVTEHHINAAWAALQGARAAYVHSPNSETGKALAKAVVALDYWLDRLPR
jgi:hypothetical protein